MTWKENVVRAGDRKILPPRIFLYGLPGIGKSSWAASLPSCILIDYDRGADEVKVDQVDGPKTWEESMKLIRDIANDPSGYKSLALDTVDVLAEQAEDFVVRESGVPFSKMNDNFGAGHRAVGIAWRVFLAELDEARKKGLNVCLVGHAVVRQAVDPQLGPYDQFTAQLPKGPWASTYRWADAVLFAAFDAERNVKEDRAIVTGERMLFTVRGSGFESKNRFNLERRMPLSWKAFEAAVATHRVTGAQLVERILKLATTPELLAKAQTFIGQADGDLIALRAIETKLLKRLGEGVATPVAEAKTERDAAAVVKGTADATILRIMALSGGTEHETKARRFIEEAEGSLEKLLAIEKALQTKLAPQAPPNGSATP